MPDADTHAIEVYRAAPLVSPERLWAMHDMPSLVGVIARCWPGGAMRDSDRKQRTLALIEQAIVYLANSPERLRAKALQCTAGSAIQALADTASLGFNLNRALGEAHLIPYGHCLTHMTGYRGFVKLIIQTGTVASCQVDAVYRGERFVVRAGTSPGIEHEVRTDEGFSRADEDLTHTYMVINNLQGPPSWCVMDRAQVDKVRASSKAQDGPWFYWYGEMAKKSVIRRGQKQIPLRTEDMSGRLLLHAMELDNRDFDLAQAEAAQGQRMLWRDYLGRGRAALTCDATGVPAEVTDNGAAAESPESGGAAIPAPPGPESTGAAAAGPGAAARRKARPKPPPEDVTAELMAKFRTHVARRRQGNSSLSDDEFIDGVFMAECGKGILSVTRAEFDAVGLALGAGKYDWDTGERVPDAEGTAT